MLTKKKLQVFVSSTFTDLREERQAAVEAILTAGHIPAGMELFAAGDQSQMEVINRWIDESDVFLLILGGRYGSLEPISKRSYVELEYERAQEKKKPSFAVVINEEHLERRVRDRGTEVIETESSKQLKAFRRKVLSKMSKFWNDPRDIKLAILETLSEFSRRDELVGWIPGDQSVDAAALAEEIARLTKENSSLRRAISENAGAIFGGLTFQQLCQILLKETIDPEIFQPGDIQAMEALAPLLARSRSSLLHAFWLLEDSLAEGILFKVLEEPYPNEKSICDKLQTFGLVHCTPITENRSYNVMITTVEPELIALRYNLTENGMRFRLRLKLAEVSEELQ
jgi:hypothetical protein